MRPSGCRCARESDTMGEREGERKRERERVGVDAAPRSSVLEDADAKCDSNYCRRLTLSHPRVCSSDPLKRRECVSLTPDVRARFGLGDKLCCGCRFLGCLGQMRMDKDLSWWPQCPPGPGWQRHYFTLIYYNLIIASTQSKLFIRGSAFFFFSFFFNKKIDTHWPEHSFASPQMGQWPLPVWAPGIFNAF